MPYNQPVRRKILWLRAWPGWIFAAFAAFFISVSIIGDLPALQPYRIGNLAVIGGGAFLIVFGIPLLMAWAIWSLLRIRGTAARTGIYLALLLADIGFSIWLIATFFHPEM